jgi:diacylglycerol kinase family enzyme
MAGIGIVNNPRSRRNLRAPETARRLRALLDDDGEVADASTPDELAGAIERFRAREFDLVAVNGGDGTGHYVLTALARAYRGRPLPAIALLRGGSMNTVAHAHDLRGSPEAILRGLLEHRRSGSPLRSVVRDLLAVETDGGPPREGFLFGTGAVASFLDAYYARRNQGPLSAALLVLRTIGSAIVRGRLAQALMARERLRVVCDGEEWPDGPFLSILAGSVPEIGLGFAPFTRCDEQPGFFHAVGVTGTLLQVVAHAPRIWLGRPWRRTLAYDEVTRDLVIEGPVRFMIDGDLYEARDAVRVRTGPPVRLVLP